MPSQSEMDAIRNEVRLLTRSTDKHDGMWKILTSIICILGVFCGFMYNLQKTSDEANRRNLEKIGTYVASIDKTLSIAITQQTTQIDAMNVRINILKDRIWGNAGRLDSVEELAHKNEQCLHYLDNKKSGG